MAVTINGKVYRNLQEQVAENANNIDALQEQVATGKVDIDALQGEVATKQDKIEATSADAGKLVGVDSNGNLTLVNASTSGGKTFINSGMVDSMEGTVSWENQNTYIEQDNDYLLILENKSIDMNYYCIWSSSFHFPKPSLYPGENYYYTVGFPSAPSGNDFENSIGGPIDIIIDSAYLSEGKLLLQGYSEFRITGSSEGTTAYLYKLG